MSVRSHLAHAVAMPALCAVLLTACRAKPPVETNPDEKPIADAAPAPEVAPPARSKLMAYAWSVDKGASYDHVVPFHWLTLKGLDPAAVKVATDAQPAGHRSIFSWDVHRGISKHPKDVCRAADGTETKHRGIWWDNGVDEIAGRFDTFLAGYKELGGKLDVFVLDFEGGLSNWHLGKEPEMYAAIAADPRFAEVAKELGFEDVMTVCNWWQMKGEQRGHYLIWNALMQERVAAYVGRAVYDPVKKYFPDALMSNYGDHYHDAAHPVPDHNGHQIYAHRHGRHVGTHQSRALYAGLGQVSLRKLDGESPYAKTPFNGFRFSLNEMLSMSLSSDVPTQPWISHWEYEGSLVRGNDLYKELVYHTVLAGADDILYWNPRPWRKDQDASEFADASQDQLMNDMLALTTDLVGYEDRRTLQEEIVPWGATYALSGMRAGGRSVWRFTPAPGPGRSLRIVKDPAAFVVDAQRIEIPGGAIHTPEKPLSKLGWWVVAPADARPVVTPVKGEKKATE